MSKIIPVIFLLSLLVGCSEKQPINWIEKDKEYISNTIAGTGNIVERVYPPIGPFSLTKKDSRYWKVYVPQTKETYFVEAHVSLWSIVTDDIVYSYTIYHKVPLANVYTKVDQ